MAKKAKKVNNDEVIISSSLLCWDPSKYVFHLTFDLGIGEEWLPKHLLAGDNDAEFWQSIAMNEKDCDSSSVSASATTTLNTSVSSISSYVCTLAPINSWYLHRK